MTGEHERRLIALYVLSPNADSGWASGGNFLTDKHYQIPISRYAGVTLMGRQDGCA